METSPPRQTPPAFDAHQRFVRLRRHRPDGFVEFYFALGDPSLCMELILPAAAFEAFCRQPGTCAISDAQAAQLHAQEQAYLYGTAATPASPFLAPSDSFQQETNP